MTTYMATDLHGNQLASSTDYATAVNSAARVARERDEDTYVEGDDGSSWVVRPSGEVETAPNHDPIAHVEAYRER